MLLSRRRRHKGTKSPRINKIRKTIIELAAVIAGEEAGQLGTLAIEYDADLSRFRSRVPTEPIKCILCGLCVRRCIEANWDSAIGFVGRGVKRRVVLLPEKAGLCSRCNYCYGVCPTGRISFVFGPSPPSLTSMTSLQGGYEDPLITCTY